MKKYQNIIVSGSLAFDRIMDFRGRFLDHILPHKIHDLNVSFHAETFRESYGGTAGNIAYSLGLLGEKPVVMGTVGNDFGKYNNWLRKHCVNLHYVSSVKSKPTASVFIITDQDNNQISAFCPGAMSTASRFIPRKLLGGKTLGFIAPGNVIDILKYSRQYQRSKTRYFFDPGQQITSFNGAQLRSCISGAYGFISNDYELALVLKKTGWSLSKLHKTVPVVVTTLGAKGSIIHSLGKKIVIPSAKPKNTSDPTGAGDAYRAGFIKALQLGLPLETAGRLGAVVSVYSVETYGTQTHHFNWQNVIKRYKRNFKKNLITIISYY